MARFQRLPLSARVCSTTLANSGVSAMPSKLDTLALKMAAGRLPPAMLTITTDVETVLGSAQRKKMLCQSKSPSAPKKGRTNSANAGNNTNVVSCTSACRRQLPKPSRSCATLSFSP